MGNNAFLKLTFALWIVIIGSSITTALVCDVGEGQGKYESEKCNGSDKFVCARRIQIIYKVEKQEDGSSRWSKGDVREERLCESVSSKFPHPNQHLQVHIPIVDQATDTTTVTIEYRCRNRDYCNRDELMDSKMCENINYNAIDIFAQDLIKIVELKPNQPVSCVCGEGPQKQLQTGHRDQCEWSNYKTYKNNKTCTWDESICIIDSLPNALGPHSVQLQCQSVNERRFDQLRCRMLCKLPSCNTDDDFKKVYCAALRGTMASGSRKQEIKANRFGDYVPDEGCAPNGAPKIGFGVMIAIFQVAFCVIISY